MRSSVALAIVVSACLLGFPALAETVTLSVYSPGGELIVDVEGALVLEGERVAKLPPRPDGTWTVDLAPLTKYTVSLYGSTFVSADFRTPSVLDHVVVQLPGPRTQQATPVNDTCETATELGPPPVGAAGDTSLATFTGPYPFCQTSHTSPELWYDVIGDGTTLTATTCNQASFDTKLTIYCLDCDPAGGPVCVAGNDDDFIGGCGLTSTASWCSEPGNTYHVMVHGFSESTGTFDLDVTSDGVPCPAMVTCNPFIAAPGACCFCDCFNPPRATCDEISRFECEQQGGQFLGVYTECTLLDGPAIPYADTPDLPIPDAGPPVTTDIVVAGTESCMVGDVNVEMQITGTFIGDLFIEVISPAETTIVLWPNVCGGVDNFNATADDDGTATLCADVAAGPSDAVFYDPRDTPATNSNLGDIEGEQSGGTWMLRLEDTFAGDPHTLDFWALHITCAVPACDPSECVPEPPLPGDDESDDSDDESDDSDDGSRDVADFFTVPQGADPTRLAPRPSATDVTGGEGERRGSRGRRGVR